MSVITIDSLLTSHQVGRLLQVSRRSVNNWIEQGKMAAFRTPGGHRRVRATDLIAFLRTNELPIPRDLDGLSKRRIMMVDDYVQQLRAFQRLLEPYDSVVELRVFERGIDALLELGAFNPDVVVLDVVMPGLDGLEVCRRIKATERTADVDVIVCSGKMSPDIEAQVVAAGARCFLPKPLDVDRLIAELRLPKLAVAQQMRA